MRSISTTGVVLIAGVECLADAGYATKVKTWLMAVQDRKDRPKLVHPGWPVKVKTGAVLDDPDVIFMVLIVDREEKGFDFNVATHLLTDVCEQRPTRAVVISNDSDLALPIKQARLVCRSGLCILVPKSPSMRSVAALTM